MIFPMNNSFWEAAWDQRAQKLQKEHPLKTINHSPNIPDITSDTRKNLRLKALHYLLKHDRKKLFLRHFLKKPIKNGWRLFRSYLNKESYLRENDVFFYGIQGVEKFEKLLEKKNIFLTVGFSYCHKPLECPSGRFSDQCKNDPEDPVCGQCFIGKCTQAQLNPSSNRVLFIPTIHYIGEKLFDSLEDYPEKNHLFLITACGMTLEMFADWGNAIGIQGIGIRLGGRICNTMKAFKLSERGIKPGLTTVSEKAKKEMLRLIRLRT